MIQNGGRFLNIHFSVFLSEISLLEIKKGKDYRFFNKYRNTDGFREEYYFLCMDIQIFRINFLDFSSQKGHLLWYNDIEQIHYERRCP